jgi:hypothetical protein
MGTNPQNSDKKAEEHERAKGIATMLGARVCGNGSCPQIFFCDLACKKAGYAKAGEVDGCYCPKHAQEMDKFSASFYDTTDRCDSRFKNLRLLNPTEI